MRKNNFRYTIVIIFFFKLCQWSSMFGQPTYRNANRF